MVSMSVSTREVVAAEAAKSLTAARAVASADPSLGAPIAVVAGATVSYTHLTLPTILLV